MTRIVRLATGGDGIGQLPDGRTVFVPRTAPGDQVELVRVREHRRYARARAGRIVEPSPLRTEPPCPHYMRDDCGGCQLQHLLPEAQRDARRRFVGDALRRIGGLDCADPELEAAPSDWEYRTKLTLHSDGARVGLHPIDQPAAVFDLETCLITSPALVALWRAVRVRRGLLPARFRHLVLRLDRDGGLHVIVEVAGAAPWPDADRLSTELEHAGHCATLWLRGDTGAARVVSGSTDAFPATVFEQVHPVMGARARAFALDLLGEVTGTVVWDLYAGIGETTRALAARGAAVHSVESDRRAVAYAERASDLGYPAAPKWIAGRAEEVVARLPRAELVVTNPPRSGMDERVTAALDAGGARRIAYIACDPATLARDIGRLRAYRVSQVRAFDLFPQTAHVECVALLERR